MAGVKTVFDFIRLFAVVVLAAVACAFLVYGPPRLPSNAIGCCSPTEKTDCPAPSSQAGNRVDAQGRLDACGRYVLDSIGRPVLRR